MVTKKKKQIKGLLELLYILYILQTQRNPLHFQYKLLRQITKKSECSRTNGNLLRKRLQKLFVNFYFFLTANCYVFVMHIGKKDCNHGKCKQRCMGIGRGRTSILPTDAEI